MDLLKEEMDSFNKAMYDFGVAFGAMIKSLGEALSCIAKMYGSGLKEAIRYKRIQYCPKVSSRLKYLAFKHKDPRIRKKNLKRINKILEEYYGD